MSQNKRTLLPCARQCGSFSVKDLNSEGLGRKSSGKWQKNNKVVLITNAAHVKLCKSVYFGADRFWFSLKSDILTQTASTESYLPVIQKLQSFTDQSSFSAL